jgi:GNAT superfamily N-acetyltransferase
VRRPLWQNAGMAIVSTSPERDDDAPKVRPRGLDSLMIARATHDHVPYLQRLKERVMRDRYRPAPDEEGFERWKQVYCTEQYFTDIIDNPDAMLLCIGTPRDPVGMVVLMSTEDHLEIDDLLVLTPRQGDGTRLITAALRYAEVWRSTDVHIDVYPGNEGVESFLRSHGFQQEHEAANDLGRPMLRFERAVRR